MKKRNIAIAIIIFIIIISTMLVIFLNNNIKIPLIDKIKQTAKVAENTSRTTIDVTYLEDNGNLDHEHIFKTMYDENKHWEECTVCGEKLNENSHIYEKKYLGIQGLCSVSNGWNNICSCGYSFREYIPCVWSGEYARNAYSHYKKCTNNHLFPKEQCHLANGTVLNCKQGGQCAECKYNWGTGVHELSIKDGIFTCNLCGETFGTNSIEVIRERTRLRYIYYNFKK